MYFVEKITKKYKNEKVVIFVDMDGVITDYNFNHELNFKTKRPIITNINTLKELTKYKNIELKILSICTKNYQILEKNNWLDKHAPFFKKENRIIISKENKTYSSKELKYTYLKEYIKNQSSKKIVVIDDDNEILKYFKENLSDIDLYQDSSIID